MTSAFARGPPGSTGDVVLARSASSISSGLNWREHASRPRKRPW